MSPIMNANSFLFLVAAAAVLLVGGVAWCLFRKPFTPAQWILHYCDMLLVRVRWRGRFSKRFPLQPDQGAVIICNHRSSIDPCIVHIAAGHRAVHWMVAQLYGERTFIGWLMRTLEIIPVQRRGSDISSIKAAIRLAAEGGLVGMFPEGAINRTDEFMRPVRPGAMLVALKARVPILPCYIEGSPYH
ncbi:MAG: lysophospholipid acyltransferase family protein, partial [Planctomycetota bacterium]